MKAVSFPVLAHTHTHTATHMYTLSFRGEREIHTAESADQSVSQVKQWPDRKKGMKAVPIRPLAFSKRAE